MVIVLWLLKVGVSAHFNGDTEDLEGPMWLTCRAPISEKEHNFAKTRAAE
jgi:hypothetical protein